jgi:DNA-binding transcriptional LysR family regulator
LPEATLLPIAVQAFKNSHSSIEIKLMIQPSVVLEEKLLSGELDLGLSGLMPKSSLLIVKRHGEEEIVAVANGLGIAFIAKPHIDLNVKADRLKILKTPELKVKRVMYLVTHKARRNSLAGVFVRFLRTHGVR